MLLLSIFGAIITTALSYEDSYSKGWNGGGGGGDGNADVSIAIIEDSNGGGHGGGGGGGYPDSSGGGHGGGGGGGGYDYTPSQSYENHDHHEHHEHHPEPPKGHWEQKLKWKEEWVKETKTIKKQSHETKWKSVSVPVWQDVEGKCRFLFFQIERDTKTININE